MFPTYVAIMPSGSSGVSLASSCGLMVWMQVGRTGRAVGIDVRCAAVQLGRACTQAGRPSRAPSLSAGSMPGWVFVYGATMALRRLPRE